MQHEPVIGDPVALVPRQLVGRLEAAGDGPVCVDASAVVLEAELVGLATRWPSIGRGSDDPSSAGASLGHRLSALVKAVSDLGGEVLTVREGILVAWWPTAADRQASDVARAVRCAQHLAQVASDGGTAALGASRIHIRVSCGAVKLARVGGHEDLWVPCMFGPALEGLALAEALAHDPCVSVTVEVARALGETPTPADVAPTEPVSVSVERLLAYLPAACEHARNRDGGAWASDVRLVSAMAVRVRRQGLLDAEIFERLQRTVSVVQEVLARGGGLLSDVWVDGGQLGVSGTFGLAPTAVELRPDLAARCALEALDALAAHGIQASAGLATGRAFSGVVGVDRRRCATILGECTGLARELASVAVDRVSCDAATRDLAGLALRLDDRGELQVPGHASAVGVWQVVRVRPRFDGPSVGRDQAVRQIARVVSEVDAGESRTVVIEGEPGIGKTHLLSAARQRALGRGMRAIALAGDPMAVSTPWSSLGPTLGAIFGLEPDEAVAPRNRAVAAWFAARTLRTDSLALLNPVVGTSFPDQASTRDLQERQRLESTRELLVEVLAAQFDGGRVGLFLDDLQWVDPASLSVCVRLRQLLRGLLVVAAVRSGAPASEESEALSVYAERILLDGLPRDAVAGILAERLGVSDVPAPLVQFVHRRAQGHPLFSLELVLAMHAAGLFRVVDGAVSHIADEAAFAAFPPPATIEGTVGYRIDQLDEPVALTLKAACVIGVAFDVAELVAAHPSALSEDEVRATVDDLVRVQILRWAGADRLMFRAHLVQEVAYRRMLPAQRGPLHEAAAEWNIGRGAEEAGRAPTVAWHLARTDRFERAIPYMEAAGEAADRQGASSEAIGWLEQCLDLDDRSLAAGRAAATSTQRGVWHRRLADGAATLGRQGDLERAARAGLAELGAAVPDSGAGWGGRLLKELAVHVAHQVVPRWLWKAAPGEATERQAEAARLLTRLCEAAAHAVGSSRLAIVATALAAVNAAERIDQDEAALTALGTLSVVALAAGRHRLVESYRLRMVTAVARQPDPRAKAVAKFMSLLILSAAGRFEEGAETQERLFPLLTDRAAAKRVEGSLWSVMAMNRYFQGDEAGIRRAAASLMHDETPRHRAWGANHLANLALRAGDPQRAWTLADQARELLTPIEDGSVITSSGLVGRALAEQGRGAEARQWAEGLIAQLKGMSLTLYTRLFGWAGPAEVAATLQERFPEHTDAAFVKRALAPLRRYARQFPVGQPRHWILIGRVHAAAGRRAKAQAAFDEAITWAERLGMPWERAEAAHRIARLGARPEPRAALSAAPLRPAPDVVPGDTWIDVAPTAPAPRPAAASGPVASRYRDEGLLGYGSSSVVRRVRDPVLHRLCALKVLTSASPANRERFLQEARILAQLAGHPNIVQVFDHGTDAEGQDFICMELVSGETLADRLYRMGARRLERAALGAHVDIVAQVGAALAHAHAAGVVHLDVKPQNVMIGAMGQVYLMDWGIAEVLATLEPSGRAAGTPGYMAPEQRDPGTGRIDRWTDVYGLGALLHAVLTGGPPSPEGSGPDGLGVEGLWRIARQALSDEPRHRQASVEAFVSDLRERSLRWRPLPADPGRSAAAG